MIFNDEGNGVELGDMLVDTHAVSVEEELLKRTAGMGALKGAIGHLKEQRTIDSATVLCGKTAAQGNCLHTGSFRPRVSQIHGKMILKLKEEMRREELDYKVWIRLSVRLLQKSKKT